MNIIDLNVLVADPSPYSLPFSLAPIEIIDTFIIINSKVAYRVESCSSDFDRSNDVIIRDSSNNDIGVLLLLKGKELELSRSSEYQMVALLDYVDDLPSLSTGLVTFNCDYVVIDRDYFLTYEYDYKLSSPIWGKFNHSYPGITSRRDKLVTRSNLRAEKYAGLNNATYFEICMRATSQTSIFERYLKYYHLVESNFEYDVFKKIQALNLSTDAQQMGKLLAEYDTKEFSRLIYLFENYVTNLSPIIFVLNTFAPYSSILEDLLYKFGRKDYVPMHDDISKFHAFVACGNFEFSSYRTIINHKHTTTQHSLFIGKLVMSILYKIRNSIAHNKIGEYIMSDKDVDFISDFGEPLLFEVVKQLFK